MKLPTTPSFGRRVRLLTVLLLWVLAGVQAAHAQTAVAMSSADPEADESGPATATVTFARNASVSGTFTVNKGSPALATFTIVGSGSGTVEILNASSSGPVW